MASARRALRLPPMPQMGDLIRLYGLKAKKQLSQNFILDLNVTNKMAKCADIFECHVVEVGSGPGSFTRSLLKTGVQHLHAVEIDERFLPALEMVQESSKGFMSVHMRDIRRLNIPAILNDPISAEWDSDLLPNIRLVGNLPFNVSIGLILQWLEALSEQRGVWQFGRVPMTLVFQKEVGENMLAEVGNLHRNRLALMCQNYCHVTRPMVLPSTVFKPEPKVDAWLMHFVPRRKPLIDAEFDVVEQVARGIFSMKRKYIKRSLSNFFTKYENKEELVDTLMERAGIDGRARPYLLTMQKVNSLTQEYVKLCEERDLDKFPFKLRKPPRIDDVNLEWCTIREDKDEEQNFSF